MNDLDAIYPDVNIIARNDLVSYQQSLQAEHVV